MEAMLKEKKKKKKRKKRKKLSKVAEPQSPSAARRRKHAPATDTSEDEIKDGKSKSWRNSTILLLRSYNQQLKLLLCSLLLLAAISSRASVVPLEARLRVERAPPVSAGISAESSSGADTPVDGAQVDKSAGKEEPPAKEYTLDAATVERFIAENEQDGGGKWWTTRPDALIPDSFEKSKVSAKLLKRFEKVDDRSTWSVKKKKIAVLVGAENIFRRDYLLYQRVLTEMGYRLVTPLLERFVGVQGSVYFVLKPNATVSVNRKFSLEQSNTQSEESEEDSGEENSAKWKELVAQSEKHEYTILLCLALHVKTCFPHTAFTKSLDKQRVNRLHGLREVLWSKDNFCSTVEEAVRRDPLFAGFTFPCWILPKQKEEWKEVSMDKTEGVDLSWIVKPLDKGGGRGIFVVDGKALQTKEKVQKKLLGNKHRIVQLYMNNPHLIKQRKWDLRTYVMVTSIVPLRAYFYGRGLVRFASTKYDANAANGGKKTQFLTNTSVNRKASGGQNLEDLTWSFQQLAAHLHKTETPFSVLFDRIEKAITLMLLSAEPVFRKHLGKYKRFDHIRGKSTDHSCRTCYQLLGIDLLVDADLIPKVIEVNGEPSMELSVKDKGVDEKLNHYDRTKTLLINTLAHTVLSQRHAASSLADDLKKLNASAFETESTDNLAYLLDMKREQHDLGFFRRIYPSSKNGDLYRRFLSHTLADEARLSLHDMIHEMELIREWRCKTSSRECMWDPKTPMTRAKLPPKSSVRLKKKPSKKKGK